MSYTRNQVISLIYRIFKAEGWTWAKDEITYDSIIAVIEGLEESAYECKGWAETGRILVKYDKDTRGYDYYLTLGHE